MIALTTHSSPSTAHTFAPMTADDAEVRTGLTARELFRPAAESDCGLDVYPKNGALRYQLGRVHYVRRVQQPLDGICDYFCGPVALFELVASGADWEEAVLNAQRKLKSNPALNLRPALPGPVIVDERLAPEEFASLTAPNIAAL